MEESPEWDTEEPDEPTGSTEEPEELEWDIEEHEEPADGTSDYDDEKDPDYNIFDSDQDSTDEDDHGNLFHDERDSSGDNIPDASAKQGFPDYLDKKRRCNDSDDNDDDTDDNDDRDDDEHGADNPLITAYPNIKIPIYKKIGEKRSYDKKQACFLCGSLVIKLPRHFHLKHSSNMEVARVLAIPNQEEKERELTRLRGEGAFDHNLRVIEKGEGTILVARRSTVPTVVEDYLPCLHCKLFFIAKDICAHVKHCPFNNDDDVSNDDENRHRMIKIQCQMLLDGAARSNLSKEDKEFQEKIMAHMNEDNIITFVKNDDIIQEYGKSQLRRKGAGKRRDISRRLRALGRLLEEVRKTDSTMTIHKLLAGGNFDMFVEAVTILCKPSDTLTANGVKMFQVPSIGIHIGNTIPKILALKIGNALRQDKRDVEQEALAFKQLFLNEYTDKVTSIAHQTLRERKYNEVDLLPLSEDLKKLSSFLNERLKGAMDDLTRSPSKKLWKHLCHITYVSVTVYNKRRGGEVARMKFQQYMSKQDWDQTRNKDVEKSLSSVEKELVKR